MHVFLEIIVKWYLHGVVSSKNGKRRPRESGFMFMIRLFIVAVLFRARFPYFWLKHSLLVTLTRENKSFCSSNLLPEKKMFCYVLCIFPRPGVYVGTSNLIALISGSYILTL